MQRVQPGSLLGSFPGSFSGSFSGSLPSPAPSSGSLPGSVRAAVCAGGLAEKYYSDRSVRVDYGLNWAWLSAPARRGAGAVPVAGASRPPRSVR